MVNKKDIIVKCVDNCSCLSVNKFDDEDEYYVTFYKSYYKKRFFFRLKDALKTLLGKDVVGTEIVLSEEDFNKLKNF